MSAAPISAAEPKIPAPTRGALERAGWPIEAWVWEQMMAAAMGDLMAGDRAAARNGFADAQALAERALPAEDLRRLTAAADLALLHGNAAELAALAGRWEAGETWVEALQLQARARSSLFHLRLEAKHRGGYQPVQRRRHRKLWLDGAIRLADRAEAGVGAEDARRALTRWRAAAATTGFVDARKLLAASLLLCR
jgi:hypothetical protein